MEQLENEVWKLVPEYPNYEASSLGRIKNIKRKKESLSPKLTKDKYHEVTLYRNGKGRCIRAHIVIAKTWIDNPENKPQINHKNCNRIDNKPNNLEWCTASENIKHGFTHGAKTQKGEKNNQAKITREIAESVRTLYAEGNLTQWQVGDRFRLKRCHVKDITTHKIWK